MKALKSLKSTLAFVVFATATVASHAVSNNGAHYVSAVGIHDTGNAYIVLSGANGTESCNYGSTTIVIPASNPQFKSMYATALTAFSMAKRVQAYVHQCTSLYGGNFPTVLNMNVMN